MRRKCTDSLIRWKKSSNRKPLILHGLRQTGKTWLLTDFGSKHYEHTLYINLETDQPAADYLTVPHDSRDVLLFLETCADKPLFPSSSLLILDNIQCVPGISRVLASISADFPQYHIVAATRGVSSSSEFSACDFELLDLFPLDFEEFLWANAEFSLAREIRTHFINFEPLGTNLHEKAMTQFRLYQIIGGMPAAIMNFRKEKKLLMVPDIQQKLLSLFLNDINALAPKGNAGHCQSVWLSIPSQLGRTSRKFQYARIKKGASAKIYQEPLHWLIHSGLVLPCRQFRNINAQNALHLYPIDTGLCTRILHIPSIQLLSGMESSANTACTESFLAQHFVQNGYTLSYWFSGNQAEVPFLLSRNNRLIAADYRTTPHQKCRSLMQLYTTTDSQKTDQLYLFSAEDFKQKDYYRIVPIYAAFCI